MQANETRKLSDAGARFIESFEGCVLHPYNDPNNATIGIGHLIHYGPYNQADLQRYAHFTMADAFQLLHHDVEGFETQIRELIHVELNPHQWDALVSLVFNCGPGVLEGRVGELINTRQFGAAANAWQEWDHDGDVVLPGLARRRRAERQLWNEPPAPYIPGDEQNWIREYDRLTTEHRAPLRRAWLRTTMSRRRKQIWHAAQKTGWNELNRTNRYHELARRTE